MWFCMNDGFISAVVDDYGPDKSGNTFKIRARFRQDLEDIFPDKDILETDNSDYRYRVFATRKEFADMMHKRIMDIDYTNFKGSVERDDLHTMYGRFWSIGYNMQEDNQVGKYLYGYDD